MEYGDLLLLSVLALPVVKLEGGLENIGRAHVNEV